MKAPVPLSKLKDTNVSFSSRLNSSESNGEPVYIQMVSALVLQLIQCVVHLPSERDAEDEHSKKVETKDGADIKKLFLRKQALIQKLFYILCTFS